MNWALENEYINIDFELNAHITREEMAYIVSNVFSINDEETSLFADDENISDYAKNAVYSLKSANISQGNNDMFMPQEHLTRVEASAIIQRLNSYLLAN